jgi:hypothetical protein
MEADVRSPLGCHARARHRIELARLAYERPEDGCSIIKMAVENAANEEIEHG